MLVDLYHLRSGAVKKLQAFHSNAFNFEALLVDPGVLRLVWQEPGQGEGRHGGAGHAGPLCGDRVGHAALNSPLHSAHPLSCQIARQSWLPSLLLVAALNRSLHVLTKPPPPPGLS